MIKTTITLNNVKVVKDIPTRWAEVTFSKFLQLSKQGDDYLKVISLFTGVPEDTLIKAKISNLDDVLVHLTFLKSDPVTEILSPPTKVLGYDIPKDLGFKTIGQLKDIQRIWEQGIEDKITPLEQLERFPLYLATYALTEYDYRDAEALAPVFLEAPCPEVLYVGNFTLTKLVVLKTSTKSDSPRRKARLKKWKLAFRGWLSRMAFMVRFSIWNRLHRTGKMSS